MRRITEVLILATARAGSCDSAAAMVVISAPVSRSEEHTSELQSRFDLVCRLLLEKKKKKSNKQYTLKPHHKYQTHQHNNKIIHASNSLSVQRPQSVSTLTVVACLNVLSSLHAHVL